MNPLNPIYGGIAGAKLPVDEYDLGAGAVLKATYAHVMSPFLMAFSPAEPGKPHPPPWKAVSGGLYYDVHIELEVNCRENPEWLDGPHAIWWIAALLRLRTTWAISVPVFSDCTFHKIASTAAVRVFPCELMSRSNAQSPENLVELRVDDLDWVAQNWKRAALLFHRDRDFALAFNAFDASTRVESPSLCLLTLWGALEHLFSPAKQELRFRVCALIACYIAEPGEARIELHKMLTRLYDQRSQAAHSAQSVEVKAAEQTYAIMKEILMGIISDDAVPSRELLEKRLFGATK